MAKVEIYTRDWCGYCLAAKRLLASKGVAFHEYNAGESADLRKQMIARSNGRSTFPQVFIDDRHYGGSDDIHALDRAGKLDALLNGAT
jgi:glutaredoxin 3